MSAQTSSAADGRSPRSRDREIFTLLSEQGAVAAEQLPRFLAASTEEVDNLLDELTRRGHIEGAEPLAGGGRWIWLSPAGAAACGIRPFRPPSPRSLAHRRAIIEVRLLLVARAPEGRWVPEREIARRRERGANVPDAVFEVGGERHAIEVELTPKSLKRLRLIVAEHCRRYDAVIYFCAPAVRRLFERHSELNESSRLFLRELPDPSRELTRPDWRCGVDPRGRRPLALALRSSEASLLKLVAEQGAAPLDQLPRLLFLAPAEVEGAVERLHSAGCLGRARPLEREPEWVWLTRRGAWGCGSQLKPAPPRVGGLAMLRAVNEARIYVTGRAPEARWVPRRALLRRHGRNASVPRGVLEIGSERHAIEVELRKRSSEDLERYYARRCREYDAVVVFAHRAALPGLRRLARDNHWPNVLVRPLPGSPGKQGSAGCGNRAESPMLPVPPDEFPTDALRAIAEAADLDRVPQVHVAARRFGSALWRVETAEAGVWRVHHGRFGWRVKRQPQMREIDVTDVEAEELSAIQRAADLDAPPELISAQRRAGRGARTLRAVTDSGTWRVAHTRWGWTAKEVGDFF